MPGNGGGNGNGARDRKHQLAVLAGSLRINNLVQENKTLAANIDNQKQLAQGVKTALSRDTDSRISLAQVFASQSNGGSTMAGIPMPLILVGVGVVAFLLFRGKLGL